jgi:hypothetical protein
VAAVAGKATKILFDDDGAACDIIAPLRSFATAASSSTTAGTTAATAEQLSAEAAAHIERVKARLLYVRLLGHINMLYKCISYALYTVVQMLRVVTLLHAV